ncbi:MAG: sigma-70 family RNA polymerase sigma factor [Lacipirellulaceae bacterium]
MKNDQPEKQTPPDDLLLARFVQTKDEAAFRELVERHSGLVLGVCTRVLHSRHDAEEAFQATFMVLAQKADRIEIKSTLGPWLYGVAYRVALRAAQKRARRREDTLITEVMDKQDVFADLTDSHWRAVLDDELNALPKKYREPLVLHYLLGKKNPEIAAELGLTVRTVEGRQRRGKEKLRRRLALKKISLPLAVATLGSASQSLEAATLETLVESTVQASLSWVAGKELAAGYEGAVSLARPEVVAMQSSMIPAAVLASVLIVAGATFGLAGEKGAKAGSTGEEASAVKLAGDDASPAAKPLKDVAVQLAAATTEVSTPIAEPAKTQAIGYNPFSDAGKNYLAYLPRTLRVSERRIYETLEETLTSSLDFQEIPLNQIIDVISEEYGFTIVFDRPALEEFAISEETEVTIKLNNLPLKSALNLMLAQVEDLTYLVKNDVLLITSQDVADSYLETRIYDVNPIGLNSDAITKVLEATVEHDSWSVNGTGEGMCEPISNGLISISQTQAVHERIAAFLAELEEQVEGR